MTQYLVSYAYCTDLGCGDESREPICKFTLDAETGSAATGSAIALRPKVLSIHAATGALPRVEYEDRVQIEVMPLSLYLKRLAERHDEIVAWEAEG